MVLKRQKEDHVPHGREWAWVRVRPPPQAARWVRQEVGEDRPRHAAIWPFCVLLSPEGGCAVSHGYLVPQAVPSGH